MEARKIVVVSTKTQKKSVIMSSATTLGELKADLRENDIDYTDMDFYEGTAKVQLVSDDAVLPHDVPYKGTITNELVFMLTNMNKKIESGIFIDDMSRAELYNIIKEHNLKDTIKNYCGRNYTQVPSSSLIATIKTALAAEEKTTTEKNTINIYTLQEQIDSLYKSIEELKKVVYSTKESSSYSDKDIDEMFDFLND